MVCDKEIKLDLRVQIGFEMEETEFKLIELDRMKEELVWRKVVFRDFTDLEKRTKKLELLLWISAIYMITTFIVIIKILTK